MAERFGKPSPAYEAVENAFATVGLNGTAQPTLANCVAKNPCSFARALKNQARSEGESESAVEMLETLYRARGALAQELGRRQILHAALRRAHGTDHGTDHARFDARRSRVVGLEELTPALNALIEGEGEEFELSPELMGRIEAALERLAQDDRLYAGEGAGELAELIEEELGWMDMSSYGGMNFASGFSRLNNEVEANSTLVEPNTVTDLNCLNSPYNNNFEIDGFYVDTPGHYVRTGLELRCRRCCLRHRS